jgi:hypothetical protein
MHKNDLYTLLKGTVSTTHEIGKACRLFHWIDFKFKGVWIMLFFNLYVVFPMNLLNMAPNRVRFSPGFLSEAGFPGEQFAPACF